MPVGVQTAVTGTFRTHLNTPWTITSHPRNHFNAIFGLRRDWAPIEIPSTPSPVVLPPEEEEEEGGAGGAEDAMDE